MNILARNQFSVKSHGFPSFQYNLNLISHMYTQTHTESHTHTHTHTHKQLTHTQRSGEPEG